jgi:hypothetical protein
MFRFVGSTVFIAVLLVGASLTISAPASAEVGANPSLLVFHLPPSVTAPAVPVASNWTFFGCWQPRLGTPCSDVFRDSQGGLWVCKACGTTGNPTPGKCRRTTQAELDSGLWCS